MQYVYHLSHQRGNDFILPGSQKLVSVCPGSGPSTQELIMIWTHFFLKGRNLQSKAYSEHKIWLRVALRKPYEGCLYEEWSETGLLNHFSQYSYGIHNLEGNWRIVFVVQVSVPCITSPFRVEEYTACVIAFHGNIINMSFIQGDNQINNQHWYGKQTKLMIYCYPWSFCVESMLLPSLSPSSGVRLAL